MNHQSNDSVWSAFNTEAASNLHLGFIERRWEVVAAIAWKEYLAHGRGALLFTPSAEIGGEFDSIYMPLDSFGGHPLLKEYSNLIESYDPTKQIVALFLTPPSCVSAYCGGLTPERLAPPEAYREVRRELNWN